MDRRSPRRQIFRWWLLGYAFLKLLAILLVLAGLGATYESFMTLGDAQRFPPPGRMVDIGGRQLHLVCQGDTGGPTVVLETGYNSTSLAWIPLQQQLATEQRVCAYDRAGSGWSDPGPLPRTPEHIADDLHALLAAAGEPEPYILVAHSLGGRYVRMFALRYPEEVAGLVLIDVRSEYYDQTISAADRAAMLEDYAASGQQQLWLRRLGLLRLMMSDYPDLYQIAALHNASAATQTAIASEMASREENDAELQHTSLGNLPLRVLVATDSSAVPNWLASQQAQAASSSASALWQMPGGHGVSLENMPTVIAAIREVRQLWIDGHSSERE
ncbi:alpha/beta fold hydrolase [Candidatus Oscillochloris fontis]|uniref:alpha/beta fold hydrolase n=1 Tax=Candidatus Oscillochloris fontis TaxID=2496868 RepID=UPI001376175E|nr:alpha/beta hydrolase [Candidatus Oscillochloris fontis]